MDAQKPKKSCYNCMKRRIICDLSEPACKKCLKKDLACPGYGVRYRFAGSSDAASKPQASPPAAAARSKKDLKWVEYAKDPQSRGLRKTKTFETVLNKSRPFRDTALAHASLPDGNNADDDTTKDAEDPVFSEIVPSSPGSSDDLAADCGTSSSPTTITVGSEHSTSESMSLVIPHTSSSGSIPLSLEEINMKTRFLFEYFASNVSPVMLMFDDASNGYRHQVLPLAHADPVVQRAVCVVAALHLSRKVPQLRLSAESGRSAIISKLSELAKVPANLTESTWATLLLLVVGDLVTGDEDVVRLYKLMNTFLDARSTVEPSSALAAFLFYQSQLIGFFARPALGESEAIQDFSKVLPDPMGSFEQYCPRQPSDRSCRLSLGSYPRPVIDLEHGGGFPGDSDGYLSHLTELHRKSTELYVLRAQTHLRSVDQSDMDRRVAEIRTLCEHIDLGAPGGHTVVWPTFVAAAESRSDEDRQYFVAILQHTWKVTGYDNVLRALNALPQIWAEQDHKRWTATLADLKTFVM